MRGPVGFPALAVALGLVAAPSTDPAHALARVRLVVATEASTAALTIAGATIASYDSAPLDALGATRTTHTGAILQLSRGTGGQTAEGQFDVVLADVPERGTITWSLTASSDAETTLEVYSINDLARPSLVDRFSAPTRNASFETDAALLDAHGAVQVAPYRPKRVLSRLIEAFDGETQYTNISLSADALLAVDRTETLRVRTFNLLRQNDRRRVWVASVSPGFDDRLVDRPTHLVVDRADARVYDQQWAAAVDTAPDWVIVTSWNEWFENSEIEPSERYGTRYLDRTRSWAAIFKNAGPPDRTPIRIATDRPN